MLHLLDDALWGLHAAQSTVGVNWDSRDRLHSLYRIPRRPQHNTLPSLEGRFAQRANVRILNQWVVRFERSEYSHMNFELTFFWTSLMMP